MILCPTLSFAARSIASCMLAIMPLQAQIVRSTAGPLTNFEGRIPKGADSAGLALYASTFLGPPSMMNGIPSGMTGSQLGFQYIGINFTVSATTFPTPNGPRFEPGGNLRRLHAHVTITPLDAAQQPLNDGAALTVLATFPDTILLRPTPPDSGTTSLATATFDALTRQFVPLLEASRRVGQRAGAELVTFTHLYHRPSAKMQVGYQSGPREVGWVWYGKEPSIIDGTHHTSVAVETVSAAKFLRVRVRLTGEWQSHGHWMREIESILTLGPAAP